MKSSQSGKRQNDDEGELRPEFEAVLLSRLRAVQNGVATTYTHEEIKERLRKHRIKGFYCTCCARRFKQYQDFINHRASSAYVPERLTL